jgi:branched-subunit amino acid transport protein
MSSAWLAVAVVGAATVLIKGAGPVLAAGRTLPEASAGVLELLAPALLAALVATNAFASDEALVLDERGAGLAAAGIAVLLKAPLLVVIVVAAVTAALLRAIG